MIMASGIAGGPSDSRSEALLQHAESTAVATLNSTPLEELDEVKVWRNAFAVFGVKPRVARNSFEALYRRCESGLPRIDLLTDLYNSISVKYRLPIGGEDLAKYQGAPRLVLAEGSEQFDTTADGEVVTQSPETGEVIWRDDLGVTCRRWNWRQCIRTRLTTETTTALFILDGLGDSQVAAATEELMSYLREWNPGAYFMARVI